MYEGTVTFDGKPVGGVLRLQLPPIHTATNELVNRGHVVLELERIADDPGQQAIREYSEPDNRRVVDLVVTSPPGQEWQSITYEVWVDGRMAHGNPTSVKLQVSGNPVVS